MPVWRREGFIEDLWTEVADTDATPGAGPVVVSLKRWLAERHALGSRAAPVGVAVEASAAAQDHLSDLGARPFVALGFAKFGDGRAYSYARLLRDRFGFRGELRATGDVLIDEIPLMLRCGFDSFAVVNEPTIRALEAGRLPGLPIHYQPASTTDEKPAGGPRPWLTVTESQTR